MRAHGAHRGCSLHRSCHLSGHSGLSNLGDLSNRRRLATSRAHLPVHPASKRLDCRVVRQLEALVLLEPILLTDLAKDLRLLHRVDPQIRLELILGIELINAVAGLLSHDLQQVVQHRLRAH